MDRAISTWRARSEARSHDCERCTQECVRHDKRLALPGGDWQLVHHAHFDKGADGQALLRQGRKIGRNFPCKLIRRILKQRK
jgi:hypothetical protein